MAASGGDCDGRRRQAMTPIGSINAGDRVTEAAGERQRPGHCVGELHSAGRPGNRAAGRRQHPAETTAINLTGNEFANWIYGNAADNVLSGGGGDDFLSWWRRRRSS